MERLRAARSSILLLLLLKEKAEKPSLRTLCGLTHNETELDLKCNGLGPGDAKLLAAEILVMTSMTRLDVRVRQRRVKRFRGALDLSCCCE